MIQEMDQKEKMDNIALATGMYRHDSCTPSANQSSINLSSGRTEGVRD